MAVCDERPKSPIEKRKRNLKLFSPISRRERETWNSFPQFREEKDKFGKRVLHFGEQKEKGIFFSQVSRGERDIQKNLKFWEEKEKCIFSSQVSRGEREFWKQILQIREEKENF